MIQAPQEGEDSSSCEVVEEHVLVELEDHHALFKSLAFDSEVVKLTGMSGDPDSQVTLSVAGKTFRGKSEPLLGTALLFGKQQQEAPVCVTRRILLRSGKGGKKTAAKRKPETTAVKGGKGRRKKKKSRDDDDDDY